MYILTNKYINNDLRKEIKYNESRMTQINNMLVTPTQNNMTNEKEQMLKSELKFLQKRQAQIYENLTEMIE